MPRCVVAELMGSCTEGRDGWQVLLVVSDVAFCYRRRRQRRRKRIDDGGLSPQAADTELSTHSTDEG